MEDIKDLLPGVSPHFVKNKEGEAVGVFIDMKDYQAILERFEDLHLGALATAVKDSGEKSRSLEDIEKELGLEDEA